MAAELRHHPRFSSHFTARLKAADGHTYDCKVVDYSHSGMKLEWPHEFQPVTGSLHTIELQLENECLHIEVEWIFQRGRDVGLKVHTPDDRLFLQLQESNQQYRASGGLADEQRQQYRQRFSRDATEFADRLIKRWLPEYLETLFDQANQGRSTNEQQQWLQLEKHVKQQAVPLIQRFKERLQQQLKRWLDGQPRLTRDNHPQQQEEWQLTLVQQTEFEDWLLAKVTASHLQSRLSRQSFEVRQLLDTLSSADSVDDCFNPIGANTLTEAFADSIEPLRLPAAARTLAFELFEQHAAQLMQTTFEALCKDIHIPMTFRYRKPRPAEVAVAKAEQRPGFNASPGSTLSATTAEQPNQSLTEQGGRPATSGAHLSHFQQHQQEARQAYANIQSLLQLRHQRQGDGSATIEQATVAEAAQQEVEHAVQQVAAQASLKDSNVLDHIERELAEQQVALPAESRDAIDTLQNVTQNLLQSQQIADFVKPHIETLGWPVLQLMLQDASLLFNPQHPGRQVLNQVARLGQLTTSGQQQLGQRLQVLIEQLQHSEQQDVGAFEALLEQVEQLVRQAERKARQNTERVAQAAEGEHQLQQARRQIEHLIGRDTAGRTLPHCVVEWLQQGWQPLLSLLLLREGEDSKRFSGAVKLYRQVLLLFSPQNAGRQELLERFRPMMELARYELDQMNGNQPHHQQWHDEILQAAEQHLSQGEVRGTIDLPEFIVADDEPAPEGNGLRKAENLQVGDWLLLTEQDQAVSIAWVAEDASKFACVNHSGMKVIDFTLAELARAFDDDRVKRLYEQQESAVDQSIDKLVEQIYRDLSEQANQDDLTGLINRAHFIRELELRFDQAVRSSQPTLLCLLDIDGFREINRQYGLAGADASLQTVATVLDDRFPDALIARTGSNEFGLLLALSEQSTAEQQVNDIEQAVKQLTVDVDGQSFTIQLSIGATALSDQNESHILLEQAYHACSRAKDVGGARVVWYSDSEDLSASTPAANAVRTPASDVISDDAVSRWYQQSLQALNHHQLALLGTPIQHLHPEHKGEYSYLLQAAPLEEGQPLLPPQQATYSDHAQRRPLEIEQWLLQQTLKWLPKTDLDLQCERLFLPCSGDLLLHEQTYQQLRQACDQLLPVGKLCLELSNTDHLADLDEAAERMHALRQLGYRFALADFGTGQSAFVALKHLPVDYVRIDHRFIDQLSTSSADYALVKSMRDIACFMAKRTVAEFSANGTSRDILSSLGVDYAMADVEHSVLLSS
ncbi:hypothetical protein CHH28_06180 [Bacterioplanes sanyensis]|uniref:GGDEF domain-containing protein n=1 Tax=Bacterioplanes sanyensis TaxID=1249553 RepID=A0A222FI14_9GAMM|nr:DUF1631 family protein [Bacterioplanes sanyensis]ASP38292.1 hypothetical protein CHH28_06180 [Bacterioplanes sanyensis]